jgi:OFA family oxalate/formate antiporter-like MFS transporter
MSSPLEYQRQDIPQTNTRGWIITLAALGINLLAGTLYAWSVLGKAMVKQWGWTKEQSNYPFAAATATFALTMIFAGRLQDKVSPKAAAMLGGLLLGLGFIGASFTQDYRVMAAAYGLVGVGIGLAYAGTTPAAIKWFPRARRGLITGLVVAGVGLAAVWTSPFTEWLLPKVGINNTLLILGLGTIAAICSLALVVRNPPADFVPPGAGKEAASSAKAMSRVDLDYQQMLKTPQFYMLWLTMVLSAAAGLMIIANVSSIAKTQAHWEAGYLAVMCLALCNTAGRVISGYVSDAIGRTSTMILAFLLQAANMYYFAHYTDATSLLIGAGFAGLCYGTIFTLFPAATADFYGVKNLGVNYGFVFTAFGVAGVTGSLMAGRVADKLGGYDRAYIISATMLAVAALLAAVTKAPRTATQPATQAKLEPAGIAK